MEGQHKIMILARNSTWSFSDISKIAANIRIWSSCIFIKLSVIQLSLQLFWKALLTDRRFREVWLCCLWPREAKHSKTRESLEFTAYIYFHKQPTRMFKYWFSCISFECIQGRSNAWFIVIDWDVFVSSLNPNSPAETLAFTSMEIGWFLSYKYLASSSLSILRNCE